MLRKLLGTILMLPCPPLGLVIGGVKIPFLKFAAIWLGMILAGQLIMLTSILGWASQIMGWGVIMLPGTWGLMKLWNLSIPRMPRIPTAPKWVVRVATVIFPPAAVLLRSGIGGEFAISLMISFFCVFPTNFFVGWAQIYFIYKDKK
jgi:uncharacterized membrane protein YqaE (UPF0057 family)